MGWEGKLPRSSAGMVIPVSRVWTMLRVSVITLLWETEEVSAGASLVGREKAVLVRARVVRKVVIEICILKYGLGDDKRE
jgi:hypothetical protein